MYPVSHLMASEPVKLTPGYRTYGELFLELRLVSFHQEFSQGFVAAHFAKGSL